MPHACVLCSLTQALLGRIADLEGSGAASDSSDAVRDAVRQNQRETLARLKEMRGVVPPAVWIPPALTFHSLRVPLCLCAERMRSDGSDPATLRIERDAALKENEQLKARGPQPRMTP